MLIKQMFIKPIDRSIDGVIKADDFDSIRNEFEEYVLTNETENRLGVFLSAYNANNISNSGSWVSGFFGSGKSHLLKIISLLLENHQIGDKNALELFLPKCGNNEILKGDIKRATDIPSQSILFNIDQKAVIISKQDVDALLSVFVKVFNEHQGLYGNLPYIAKFESDLIDSNQYDSFKKAFQEVSGKDWEKSGREETLFNSSNVATAVAKAKGGNPSEYSNILDKYRSDYTLSIDGFAENVLNYINKKGKNFRLNFFVDEVGQYIADNTKLMVNLQTIAESLATKCRGRAWLIVTAQEDMDNVIGGMSKEQANDFSKIQARFSTRLKLTSQNVDEVIQKRLLSKTTDATASLKSLYGIYSNDFKTLFTFTDGSRSYKQFKDETDFVDCYPFIPYQFELFQSAIKAISDQNGFEGRHSSVGERSMLGVFQTVAKAIAECDEREVATFDFMFEGISSALKTNIQNSIISAKNNLNDDYALKVLKALFLVKYVKEFKPSLNNICILLYSRLGEDISALRTKVQNALNRLEQDTYIQRNGDLYEFLTNEEKDIETEIKNQEIEPDAQNKELSKIIYDEILIDRKIKFDQNGNQYEFSKKLDDSLSGNREYELTINVISPLNDANGNLSQLRSNNMGKDEMMVVLPSNARLISELGMYLRTQKYIQQKTKIAQSESIKSILASKSEQNRGRASRITELARELVSESHILVRGNDAKTTATEPKQRIVEGFQELISATYTNLRMLKAASYKEDDVLALLTPNSLLENDDKSMSEAEADVLKYINLQKSLDLRVTVKNVIDHFEKKPYGWPLAAVYCMIATLIGRSKLECTKDSNALEGKELAAAIRNTQAQQNLILKPRASFSESQIRNLKTFYQEFFDKPPIGTDPKILATDVINGLKETVQELREIYAQKSTFPFLTILETVIADIQTTASANYEYFLTHLSDFENDLLDKKEQIIQPIKEFMNSDKKNIYSEAKSFTTRHAYDFASNHAAEFANLCALLNLPNAYNNGNPQKIKTSHQDLQFALNKALEETKAKGAAAIDELKDKLTSQPQYSGVSESQKQEFVHAFDSEKQNIAKIDSIPALNNNIKQFEDQTFTKLVQKFKEIVEPAQDGASPSMPPIHVRNIKVSYAKLTLDDESDLDEYIAQLKSALLNEIKNGKKVQI